MKGHRILIGMAGLLAAFFLTSGSGTAWAEDGKQLYDKNCASCHGATGKGDGAAAKMLKPPAADFAVALKGKADADIAKIIGEGGKANGKSPLMPAFKAKLTDPEIQAVVEYMKGFAAK